MTIQYLSMQMRLIVRNSIFVATEFLIFRPLFAFRPIDGAQGRRSLVCINTMFLGDIVLASECMKRLSGCGRFRRCYLVVREEYAGLCRALYPEWEIVSLNVRKYRINLAYRYAFLLNLRRLGASTAINISTERGVINDELTTLSGAGERIASHAGGRYLLTAFTLIDNLFYTMLFNSAEKNEYERLMQMLPSVIGSEAEAAARYSTLATASGDGDRRRDGTPFVIVAPLAQHGDKGWALDRYKELCGLLSNSVDVIVIGTPAQKQILSSFENGGSVRSIAGETTLEELPPLLKQCELFIGNDSGATHLAHALNVRTLAIVGGGAWGAFFPYGRAENIRYLYHQMECFGCNWTCKYPIKYCLSEISVASVYEAALSMLNQNIAGIR